MRCPPVNDLPSPPAGRTGWPWTEGCPLLPAAMPGGRAWPKISIVTPSFNQGRYLEETLRSVLLQGYPDLEYIVMDGGSTDNSAEVIRKYERWLARWVSEKDAGQSAAVNSGMTQATGEILAYLNSDDCYLPGALAAAAETLAPQPSAPLHAAGLAPLPQGWCAGDVINVDEDSGERTTARAAVPRSCVALIARRKAWVPQPSTFWTAALWRECGPFDPQMFFSFDWDLYCKFLLAGHRPVYCPRPLSAARRHGQAKSTIAAERMLHDDEVIWRRCFEKCGPLDRLTGHAEHAWRNSPRFRFWINPLNWARVAGRKISGRT